MGSADTSVGLSSVALTRKGNFFIVPPHNLERDPILIDQWKQGLVHEAEVALRNTVTFQEPEDIVRRFNTDLDSAIRGDRQS